MREKVPNLIALKDHLRDAATRGLTVRIRTPFYSFEGKVAPHEVDLLWNQMKRAGREYFKRSNSEIAKRYNGEPD